MKAVLAVLVAILVTVSVPVNLWGVEIGAPFSPGEVWDYDSSSSFFHSGQHDDCVDFNIVGGNDEGRPIIAVQNGRVTTAGWSNSYGWHVIIRRGDGSEDLYGHFQTEPFVKKGEWVWKGQAISLCGCTPGYPYCTGPHLHYGYYVDGWSQPITQIDGQSAYDGAHITSRNKAVIDRRESDPLIQSNPYSGHTPEHQPLVVFGPRDQYGTHWFHPYNQDSLYDNYHCSRNCWVQGYVGRSGGYQYDGAIIYDAAGGAKQAYVVGWQQWDAWKQLTEWNDPQWNPGEGGPNSRLGNPITNSYWNGSAWQQDFQKGFMRYDQVFGYGDVNAHSCPGWYYDGWHPTDSYLFAQAYERNGGMGRVGKAQSDVQYEDPYRYQEFRDGCLGNCTICYDTQSFLHNPAATNEAYLIFGSFRQYWEVAGRLNGSLGCPTTDEYPWSGYTRQDFLSENGVPHYLLWDGHNVTCFPDDQFNGATVEGNLVQNYGFEQGYTGWQEEDHQGTTLFRVSADSHESNFSAQIEIASPGPYYAVQLKQAPLWVVQPKLYIFSFWAKVSQARPITVQLVQDSEPWGGCGLWYEPTLTTTWQEYRRVFTGSRTCQTARLTFCLGTTSGTVWIDNVVLKEADFYNPWILVQNGSFEHGLDVWAEEDHQGVATIQAVACSEVDGQAAAKVTVANPGEYYQVQLMQPYIRLEQSQRYCVRFWAKALQSGSTLCVQATENEAPWSGCGLNEWLNPGTNWVEYWLYFNAARTTNQGRLAFCCGSMNGSLLIDKVELFKVTSKLQEEHASTFNHPNPLYETTDISFGLPYDSAVQITIYNVAGRQVRELVDEDYARGDYTVTWDGKDHQGKPVASGIYFYRLTTESEAITRKIMILK